MPVMIPLIGGNGNDTLIGGAGGDRMSGGAGTDTVSWAGAPAGITYDLGSSSTGDAAGDVIDSVTPPDVRWACQLLSRVSERQWREAFRAAQYDEQQATRYISKIKEKIAQGLALTAPPS
jgi:hypothetical protein